MYGPSAFPINTFNATNYWVDLEFKPDVAPVANNDSYTVAEDTTLSLARIHATRAPAADQAVLACGATGRCDDPNRVPRPSSAKATSRED